MHALVCFVVRFWRRCGRVVSCAAVGCAAIAVFPVFPLKLHDVTHACAAGDAMRCDVARCRSYETEGQYVVAVYGSQQPFVSKT